MKTSPSRECTIRIRRYFYFPPHLQQATHTVVRYLSDKTTQLHPGVQSLRPQTLLSSISYPPIPSSGSGIPYISCTVYHVTQACAPADPETCLLRHCLRGQVRIFCAWVWMVKHRSTRVHHPTTAHSRASTYGAKGAQTQRIELDEALRIVLVVQTLIIFKR